MRTYAVITLVFLLCLAGTVSCTSYLAADTDQFTKADLYGMIYDQHNQACPGVSVTIDRGSSQLSDVNGRFTLLNVSRGRHTLTVKKEDYEEAVFEIDYMNRTQVAYLKVVSRDQLLELAEAALGERKLDEAGRYLERAAKIKADDPLLIFLQASLALKRDQIKESVSLLLSLVEQKTAEAPVYLALADIFEYKLNEPAKAAYYLKKYGQSVESEEVKARIKRLEGTE